MTVEPTVSDAEVEAVADAINRARYVPGGLPEKGIADEDKGSQEYSRRLARAALLAAARARSAIPETEAVAVKPLEWQLQPDRPEDEPRWDADGLGKRYSVFKAWWGKKAEWAFVWDGFYHTSEEAKAAAQADYETRIRSALTHPVLPDREGATTGFDDWWSADGQYLDPDTSDVPWFDKRRGLAEYAFRAGNNGRRSETGWLIELRGKVPTWFRLEDGDNWTPDSLKALRFARREDAEAYINEIGWTEAFASEHEWSDRRAASPATGEREPSRATDTAGEDDDDGKRETGWLIEDTTSFEGGPQWYCEDQYRPGWHGWTNVAHVAKRFATKAEAEAFEPYRMIASNSYITITEHMFL